MMLPSNNDYIDTLLERYTKIVNECIIERNHIEKMSDSIIGFVFKYSKYGLIHSEEEMINDIRKQYWREVYKRSNLEDIISSVERDKINNYLCSDNLPDFNRENVESTILSWGENASNLFAEKVDSVFQRMSGTHVTNQPQGFTKKIIFKNMCEHTWFPNTFNLYSFRDRGLNIVHDLRTAIQTLYKLPISSIRDTELILKTINERNEYTSFDNGAFMIKIFKNGNSHIELNPHVAIRLNCELAKLYPTAIPPKHRTETKEIKEYVFEYQHLSEKIKDKLRELVIYSTKFRRDGKYVLNFKKKQWVEKYVKEVLDFLGIREIHEGLEYECDFDYVELIRHVIVNGMIDYKSNQFYPTPDNIVEDIVRYVGDTTDKLMLEPSAGRGNISKHFIDSNIHCIDKEELNTVYLSQLHKNVICNDFLFYTVKKESDKYDIIVMNPPYNKNQWKTHVEHALTVLKKDGVIYAVLPSGKESYFENCEVLETYTNDFENTSITTCLYKIGA